MKVLSYDSRKFFVFGARIFFGIWLLYGGLYKWIAIGPNTFVGYITSEFDQTWSPHTLNVLLSWVILLAEIVLPLWILAGKLPRLAWSLAALLMFMLVLGQSLLMKPDVIANWQYLVLTLACAALSQPVSRPEIQTT
jgi:uncharacterized membrane protein YphA (DoxX/SURF4 family)